MDSFTIVIGSDHAGYELKELLKTRIAALGQTVKDVGAHSADAVDYPDIAHVVASNVADQEEAVGILICGSANGVAMTANKHAGIRAAICWTSELAALARQHNDANILCLPARFIDDALAGEIVDQFLTTSFEGGRHESRKGKINC